MDKWTIELVDFNTNRIPTHFPLCRSFTQPTPAGNSFICNNFLLISLCTQTTRQAFIEVSENQTFICVWSGFICPFAHDNKLSTFLKRPSLAWASCCDIQLVQSQPTIWRQCASSWTNSNWGFRGSWNHLDFSIKTRKYSVVDKEIKSQIPHELGKI